MSSKIMESIAAGMNLSMKSIKSSKTEAANSAFYTILDSAAKGSTGPQKDLPKVTDVSQSEDAPQLESGQKQVTNDDGLVEKNPEPKETVQKNSEAEDAEEKSETEDTVQNLLGVIAQQLGISTEDLIANYKELKTKVTEILTEKLGITKEELMSALDKLGFTVMDVTEPSNLMELVVSMDENLDVSHILTDENLYAQVKEITEELATASADLTPEDMKQIQQIISNFENTDTNVQVNKAAPESVEKVPAKTVETSVGNKDTTEQAEIVSVVENVDEENADSAQSGLRKENKGNDGFQNFVNQLVDTVKQNGTAQASETFINQTETENIVRQLTDQIKVQVKADTTSMEMQLYPESYGKLNLHVAVKDGIVTAQIAAESEAVKKALESQVIQLRENMNEQGLKVEAIEVTVQSHEFERNLQQDQNQKSFEEEGQKARKNINLDDEDRELDGTAPVSEEEALIRKIMIQNGSRINYSA